uniref:Uncharacterized protein n=1 Tax=Panagrolaimus sp. JU765 TaxID=591449 RepID=A0AC34RR82_9BILA
MSLLFLCLIGLSAALNTWLFISQLRKSEPLCMFNNYLPYGNAEVLFDSLLQYVINEDKLFCVAMEPFLHCKLPNGTTPDAIAEICDTK